MFFSEEKNQKTFCIAVAGWLGEGCLQVSGLFVKRGDVFLPVPWRVSASAACLP
jgi:hypothetical protein